LLLKFELTLATAELRGDESYQGIKDNTAVIFRFMQHMIAFKIKKQQMNQAENQMNPNENLLKIKI